MAFPPQEQAQTEAPPITVEVPNLGTVQFPAGTSQDAMKRAIDAELAKSHVREGTPVPHPIAKRLLDWLPAAGGVVGGVLGAVAGLPEGGIGAIPGGALGAAGGGAAGESLKQNINRAIGNPAPMSAGEAAADIGKAGAVQGAADLAGSGLMLAGGKLLAPYLKTAGGAMMQSAVKPGTKATARALIGKPDPSAVPVVKTLLDEGVNVTTGGIEKLTRIIESSNAELKAALDHAPSSTSVDPAAVAARVDPLIEAYGKGANPEANVEAAKAAKAEFLRAHGTPKNVIEAQTGLTLSEAQAIKQQTYKDLKDTAYGTVKSATIESQKALARGLKEDIADELLRAGNVEANKLNAREGAAIVARDAVAKRVAAAGNRDPVAIAWLAHNPVAGLAFLVERNPATKSLLARGLYGAAAAIHKLPPTLVKTMVQAIASTGDPEK